MLYNFFRCYESEKKTERKKLGKVFSWRKLLASRLVSVSAQKYFLCFFSANLIFMISALAAFLYVEQHNSFILLCTSLCRAAFSSPFNGEVFT